MFCSLHIIVITAGGFPTFCAAGRNTTSPVRQRKSWSSSFDSCGADVRHRSDWVSGWNRTYNRRHQRIAINFSTEKQIAGFDKVGRRITAYNALTAAPAASVARMPGTVSEISGLNPYTDRDWKPVLQRPRRASTGSTRYLRRWTSLACVNRPLQVVCDPDREPRFLWNHFFI